MKSRNGFVSNSSSSSFIVAFPYSVDRSIYNQIKEFLGRKEIDMNNNDYAEWVESRKYLEDGIEHYFFERGLREIEDIMFTTAAKMVSANSKHRLKAIEIVKDMLSLRAFYASEGHDGTEREKNKIYKKETVRIKDKAIALYDEFVNKHPGCVFLQFTFNDEGIIDLHMHNFLMNMAKNKPNDVIVADNR